MIAYVHDRVDWFIAEVDFLIIEQTEDFSKKATGSAEYTR
jgi:hypothetical protein